MLKLALISISITIMILSGTYGFHKDVVNETNNIDRDEKIKIINYILFNKKNVDLSEEGKYCIDRDYILREADSCYNGILEENTLEITNDKLTVTTNNTLLYKRDK